MQNPLNEGALVLEVLPNQKIFLMGLLEDTFRSIFESVCWKILFHSFFTKKIYNTQ